MTHSSTYAILERGPEHQQLDDGRGYPVYDLTEGDTIAEVYREPGEDVWRIFLRGADMDEAIITRGKAVAIAQIMARAADLCITLNKKRTSTAVDDAITLEVRASIADRGWTQREAAAEFNLTQGQLAGLLNGYVPWKIREVVDVARALHREPAELFALGEGMTR